MADPNQKYLGQAKRQPSRIGNVADGERQKDVASPARSPTTDQPQEGLAHRIWRAIARLWIAGSLVLLVIGCVAVQRTGGSESPRAAFSLLGGLAGLSLVGAWKIATLLSRSLSPVIGRAFAPVPEPAEIRLHLWQELGREPSLEEILLTHQYLRHRRNEALFGAGAVLFLAHEAGHHGGGH